MNVCGALCSKGFLILPRKRFSVEVRILKTETKELDEEVKVEKYSGSVVTLGGGHGQGALVKALKDLLTHLTAICTPSDSGGSTGKLMEKHEVFGVNGALGDVTNCLCAMVDDTSLVKLLLHRDDQGNSVKNLLFAHLILHNDPYEALIKLHRTLGLNNGHRVLPATFERATLCALLSNNDLLKGEAVLDTLGQNPEFDQDSHHISHVFLSPQRLSALPEVVEAITSADFLIMSPGDFYTSLIPVLLVPGVAEAIRKSSAKLVMMLNIMTKRGETDSFFASDFVRVVTRYLGRQPDIVVCNENGIPKTVLDAYQQREGKVKVVADDLDVAGFQGIQLVRSNLWALDEKQHLIHDPQKTAEVLIHIFRHNHNG